jgi:hypothetical protein
MTIQELLERVVPTSDKYDPEFAAEFKSIVNTARKDRKRAKSRPFKYKAAERFYESWIQFLDLFANDPPSLAALTLPDIGLPKENCKKDILKAFPKTLVGTPTTAGFLYFDRRPPKRRKKKTESPAPKTKPAIKAKLKAT